MNTNAEIRREYDGIDEAETARWEGLFSAARQNPPTAKQLQHMLRAVPPVRRNNRRFLWGTVSGLAALAACITVVVLLGSPATPRAFAFSMVPPAMRSASVIHTIGKDWEFWQKRGAYFARHKLDGTFAGYWDMQHESYATYDAKRGCIMLSTCERLDAMFNGVESLDDLVKELAFLGRDLDADWTRRDIMRDGRPAVELTNRRKNQFAARLVFDAQSARLVQRDGWEGSQRFEYPELGPKDIYDLGVSRQTKVVNGSASADLLALRGKVMAARAASFGPYRAAIAGGGEGVYRVVTDGHRLRVEYFDDLPLDGSAESLKIAARKVLAEGAISHCSNLQIVDGSKATELIFDKSGKLIHRSVQPAAQSIARLHGLETLAALAGPESFFDSWPDRQDEFLGTNAEGWLGIRARGQANNCSRPWLHERWFDPAHNYAVASQVSANFPDAPWQIREDWPAEYEQQQAIVVPPADGAATKCETKTLEWAELRPGQWYPAIRCYRNLVRQPDGRWVPDVRRDLNGWQPESFSVIVAQPLDRVDDSTFEAPK